METGQARNLSAGPRDGDLLASRGNGPKTLNNAGVLIALRVGDRVQVSYRCGDGWGEENMGTVAVLAEEHDAKGRFFVGVLMDGQPDARGTPECEYLRYVDQKKGARPLPHFEAGLLVRIEPKVKGKQ